MFRLKNLNIFILIMDIAAYLTVFLGVSLIWWSLKNDIM